MTKLLSSFCVMVSLNKPPIQRPYFRSGHGARNRVGTECGIESPIFHQTSILETRIDYSSSTCATELRSN